jgi:hypothetical protein
MSIRSMNIPSRRSDVRDFQHRTVVLSVVGAVDFDQFVSEQVQRNPTEPTGVDTLDRVMVHPLRRARRMVVFSTSQRFN